MNQVDKSVTVFHSRIIKKIGGFNLSISSQNHNFWPDLFIVQSTLQLHRYYLVMIKIRPTEKFQHSHTIHPLTLILAIMISCCSSAPVVPFFSHQFQLTCSPVLTGTRTFNVTLPTSYNSTFSRYLVLSGFQANLRDKVNFQASLTNNTATTQFITVNTVSPMAMVLLSVQIVFISTNDWIWAMSSAYSCNSIRNYYFWFPPMSEDNYVTPTGGIIINPTQYKIIPLISFFNTASWKWSNQIYGPPNIVKFTASILSATSVKLTFRRQSSFQFVYQVGYVLLFYNTTQLQIQNFIYKSYSVTSTTAFNQPPNSSYVSTTFGGFQGNCLIGIFNIKLSGQWSVANRGPTFSKTSPISNIVNNKQSSDSFSVTYNALCFTGQTCPSPLIFNPSLQSCITCPIAHCPTCLTLSICKKCQNLYGWQAPNCSLCTTIATGCLTCDNSSYCYSCVDNHYILNVSQCVKCADFIVGCDTCSNKTVCISCLTIGFYTDSISCIPCNQTLIHCLICTNDTVCIDCDVGYYKDTLGACLPCNSSINFCSLCDNDTICLGCQIGYVLVNNTCLSCTYFLPNCTACTDSTHCTSCNVTYYLLSPTTCDLCSNPIQNCKVCNDANTCMICATGFFLDPNNKCSPCNTNIPQCIMCTDGFTCTQCATNYLLSGTVCLPCQSVLSSCRTCTNSTYCTSCISDSFFIPNSIGFCLPCSAGVMNCDRCNLTYITNSTSTLPTYKIKCIACSNPYMIDKNGQCQQCEILIPNCNSCLNYTFCDQCIDNTYAFWPNNISCLLCSDLIRNCSQCTTQICTKCMAGFKLSPNSKSCNCLMGVYKNGVCNTIKGCAKPFQYSDGSIGCLQCQQPDFFIVPVYDHCQCRKGTLIGDYCSQIKNCIAALISSNGSIYCAFCNITAGFYYLPQNLVECVCAEHFFSNGTHCNDICGDGFLMNSSSKDNCDDGNTINGDGCNENCIVQPLYRCQNGSKTSRSKCYYIGGKATVNLSKISKTWNSNQATFEFEINPKISGLSQMDYSSLLNLTCDSDYSISAYTYSQGILAVKVDYNQNMENVACNLTLDFDRNIIRSPSAKLSFNAKSSNYPLFYSIFLQSLTRIQLSFQLLSFIVLGSFFFSIAHKLIGAQLLICCQIVYLSNCFYKIPSMYLNPIKQFKFVTGDWSLFHKKQYLQMTKPFSQRVEMSAYFMENTLFVISILLFLLAIMISIFLFSMLKRKESIASQSKIPLVKKTFQSKEYQKNQLIQKQIKMKERPEQLQKFVDSLAFKALRLIFRTLFFPIVTGYFIIIVISSYIHNNSFDSKNLGEFHLFLNAGAELFAWITLGTVISFQVFGSLVQGHEIASKLVGQQNTKGWYIHVFIFRLTLVAILIELGIIYSYDFLIYVLGIVELGYMVILIFFRGYTTILDNVGVVSCLITECFAIALPIISRSLSISESSFVIMIYLLIGMLFFSIFVTNIRNYFVIKNAIVELIKFCKKGNKSKQKQKGSQDELNQELYENKKQKYHLFMKPTDEIDYIDYDLHRIQTFKQTFMRDLMLNQQKRNSPLGKFESIHMEHQEQKNINLEEDAEFRQTKERLREDFKNKIKNGRFNQSMKLTSL